MCHSSLHDVLRREEAEGEHYGRSHFDAFIQIRMRDTGFVSRSVVRWDMRSFLHICRSSQQFVLGRAHAKTFISRFQFRIHLASFSVLIKRKFDDGIVLIDMIKICLKF